MIDAKSPVVANGGNEQKPIARRLGVKRTDSGQLKLWWSAARQLDVDYTIIAAVLDRHGQLIAQADGPAASGPDTPSQTSTWLPGNYYEDYRLIQLPPGLEPGDYNLVVGVYQWWDNTRLKPAENHLFPFALETAYYISSLPADAARLLKTPHSIIGRLKTASIG